MKQTKWIVLAAAVALVVVAFTGTALATNPNAACDQTPYGTPGNGANQGGAYDDTCDGSASANGNGNGNATGRPCAGCVGNADEKNPPGQAPDASDGNAGYECDENSGIAHGNPAHTTCTPSTNPTPTPTPTSSTGAEVLGRKLTRPLATTGSGTTWLFALGMAFLGAGLTIRAHVRKAEIGG